MTHARIGIFICIALAVAAPAVAQQRTDSTRAVRTGAGARVTLAEARRRLAQIDGSIAVRGVDSAVEVRRDRWGVPHIYAKTQHDLFFAQGFVAAQDRLWQMEMWRRQSEGRLAEVLGPTAIARDRYARLFEYRGDMAREWTSYAPDAKAIVTAFVSGVNAYITSVRDRLPIEFTLLGFAPEPWTPMVPLARVTGLSGVSNGSSETLRAQLITAVGREKTEELFPVDPARHLDPVEGLDLSGVDARILGATGQTFADVAYDRIEGSNNWVVSGTKTATGKPILANDPHRVITNPAVRYITHLVAPGWNVIGAGEPASPGVSIGHNDRIGFGLTVVGMDQQDVYVERVQKCPSGGAARCYWYEGKWVPVRTMLDTIRVKGERPRTVTLEFTRHGPIVGEDSARSRVFVLRSVHAEPGTASYLASLSVDRAHNWSEFQTAMARWAMPSENMVYADVDGNIGWIAAGMMPKRSWSGLVPVSGDGRFEWSGFLRGPELPQSHNPPNGYIATANHNILPKGYTQPISYEWATRYRIDRVRQVLDSGAKFTVQDFQRLQHDDKSLLAESIVPPLMAAARRARTEERAGVRELAGWDYQMKRDAVAPLIFAAWAPAVWRRMVRAIVPQPAVDLLAGHNNYPMLEAWLRSPPSALGTDAGRARDSLLLLALDDAMVELTRRFGSDHAKWRYGDVHVVTFQHPLSATFDLPAASRGGDANTVYATGGGAFQPNAGASYREIIDFADFDKSVAINVPGQSAQPGSDHYGDLLPLWGNDKYFPLVFSRQAVERETKHVLWMKPASANNGKGGRDKD